MVLFISLCSRSQVRVGNETIKSNLKAYKYFFEPNAMDNGLVDERNKCFCRNGKLSFLDKIFSYHDRRKPISIGSLIPLFFSFDF